MRRERLEQRMSRGVVLAVHGGERAVDPRRRVLLAERLEQALRRRIVPAVQRRQRFAESLWGAAGGATAAGAASSSAATR